VRLGREKAGSHSVWGKRYTGTKYRGGHNYRKQPTASIWDQQSKRRTAARADRAEKASQVAGMKRDSARRAAVPSVSHATVAPTPARYCETNSFMPGGCGTHSVLRYASAGAAGVAVAADVALLVCALSTPATTVAGLGCAGGAATTAFLAGSTSAAIDIVDMLTGGMEPTAGNIVTAGLAPVTGGLSKAARYGSRVPGAYEAATRSARVAQSNADDAIVGAGVVGPFDVGSFMSSVLGLDE